MIRSADTRLLLCIAIGQAIGWGTLFTVFPLFGAPMETELGWSRAEINAGLTLALLVSGLAAVPVGQHVDRHGGRRMLAYGAWLGAALLALWSLTESLELYWALWAAMGLAQAAALWGPAMAVVVTAARGGFSLGAAVRRPAFLGLAACFAAHAFIAIGLGAHAIPLLRERGLPEAGVLLIVALHGPFQVAARLALFSLGKRVTMRGVGRLATLLTPVGMAVLALAPPEIGWLVLYALCWAVADGLMTIVRAAGTAEILGREGYGAITGALSVATVLPRTAAPLLIALIWEGAGGYGPVPWLLVGLGLICVAAFAAAARAR